MDLGALYGGSFVNWERVAGSWSKRTVSSRLLLFSARRYLVAASGQDADPERLEVLDGAPLPDEVKSAFAAPPAEAAGGEEDRLWGEFVDAAIATELEVISYGERPPLLHELRNGLETAAGEAGPRSPMGRWFTARREALPGSDLPEDPEFVPV